MKRCSVGEVYWSQAHNERKPACYRAAAWVEWQDHRRECRQCCEAEAAEWQKAANAPIIPFDLEGAK
jgi:hypothetical protein